MEQETTADLCRRWILDRNCELEHNRLAAEYKARKLDTERKLFERFASEETTGVVVDGRMIYLDTKTYWKLKEGVDIRSEEFREALEEAGLLSLLEPRITATDIKGAVSSLEKRYDGTLPEGVTLPENLKLRKFLESGEVMRIGNKKA